MASRFADNICMWSYDHICILRYVPHLLLVGASGRARTSTLPVISRLLWAGISRLLCQLSYASVVGCEGRDRTYENPVNSRGRYHSGHLTSILASTQGIEPRHWALEALSPPWYIGALRKVPISPIVTYNRWRGRLHATPHLPGAQ